VLLDTIVVRSELVTAAEVPRWPEDSLGLGFLNETCWTSQETRLARCPVDVPGAVSIGK
jgi:hypothetical protein